MSKKYVVTIERISPKRNHGLRYRTTVLLNKSCEHIRGGYSLTKWGAHRMAKGIIQEYEYMRSEPAVVEKYEI